MRGAKRAAGFPVLIRAFRLTLTVEGLRPKTVENYVRDVQGFAAYMGDKSPLDITPTDVRAYFGLLRTPVLTHFPSSGH